MRTSDYIIEQILQVSTVFYHCFLFKRTPIINQHLEKSLINALAGYKHNNFCTFLSLGPKIVSYSNT